LYELKFTADIRIFSIHSNPHIPEHRNLNFYSEFILGTKPWKSKKQLEVVSSTIPPADRK